MERQRESVPGFFAALPSVRITLFLILATAGVAFAATLCASGKYREAVLFAAAAFGAGALVAGPISVPAVLVTWFATFPLASFYLRFPQDRSILTYNRLVFAMVVIMLLVNAGNTMLAGERASAAPPLWNALRGSNEFSVSKFEIVWGLLSVLALASALAKSNNVAYATRIAVDSFWLPLVAFHVARNYLDLHKSGRLLLPGGIGLALFFFATGAFEIATGTDLFAYKGSELVREGERRVNGPFAADSSFAIICLIFFLFLLAAPRLFRVRFDRTGKLIFGCAVGAAAIAALLPVFRIVGLAMVVSWFIFQWSTQNHRGSWLGVAVRRRVPLGVSLIIILIAAAGWIATGSPSISGRLTDPRSAYGRLATWVGAAEIVFDNPIVGVGLANYADYYDATHYYADEASEEVFETKAAASPHSNVLWIGAELGLTALALYLAANAYLFLMGWRAIKVAKDSRQRLAASCLLAIVVAYWIPGLTLSSGYYSDLNLYFLFLVGALSRFATDLGAPAVSERS
jgi:O-antigen ligase